MKAIVFDSGPLINLSMNGLLYILEDIKKEFNGKLLITKQVKEEIIDRPLNIQKFELGALNIKRLLDMGIIELPSNLGIDENTINQKTEDLLDLANHYIQVKGQWVHIVSPAEMSCLALSEELKKRDIDNLIAIDERTTRVLSENPEKFLEIMAGKLRQRPELVVDNIHIFKNYKFIRSTELVYVAYKKGMIKLEGKNVLEALLYATKFKGSSITTDEIETLKKV